MADFNSKYTGEQVESLLDIVSQGGGSKSVKSAPTDNMSGEILINFSVVPMQPDVVYVANTPVNAIYNLTLAEPQTLSVTYTLHFTMADVVGIFVFPENLLWANGKIPTIEAGASYELSIVATKLTDEYIYKAVLTSFKASIPLIVDSGTVEIESL